MTSRLPFLLALILVTSLACKKKPEPQKDQPRGKADLMFPVEVAKVETRAVEYVIEAVGSVDAFESVQVTARVAGAVERVRFQEGEVVKAGSVLVEIEPGRYTLAVRSAEATLARALAAKADADRGFERRKKMAAEGIASVEEMDSFRTKLETSRADESAARAQLALAQLNLRDAYVTAPIDGTVQTRTVQTGQYLQPGAVLATLVRRDPLLLRFKVPEHEAQHIAVGVAARFRVRGIEGNKTAVVKHVAGRAEGTTRMVEIVAEIGKDDALRPGAFAEVQVPSGGAKAAVVPQTAVRPSERGFLAFIVDQGKAVERIVTIGRRTADGHVEVLAGLSAGEDVVVRGAEALTTGAKLQVASASTAASAVPSSSAR
jgi:RND family efflux transporter MFP subunit